MNNVKLVLNEPLPAELREAMEEEAERLDLTMNDLAVKILSMHFHVAFEPSERSRYKEVSQQFKLRISDDLHMRIRVEAANERATVRGLVISILGAYYGFDFKSGRRPRKPAAA